MSRLWLPIGHAAERLRADRRAFISTGMRAGVGAAAALALGACDSRGPRGAERLLAASERWNERVERALFRHTSMNDPPAGARAAGAAFPSYFVADEVPVWDEAERGLWRLEIGGLVRRPVKLTLDELKALPRAELRLEHFCVEGWSAVSVKTGVLLSELARRAEVSPDARFVDFESFDDDYHESWDLESALHPQTLIVYGQDGRLLDPAYGAPARVYSPVKLGYKNTKYLTRVMFLPAANGGYWSDQGYEWYGGV
ncbi:MAG TPA: molybdopterin-dependent oxidoreductase [Polyangia bacterium]|nr:molybdopterin-dependent oxidoreductase [Polyangia bacterium]